MFGWSPDAWNGIGVVAVVCMVGAGFWLSIVREWLVLGSHHREIVRQYEKTNQHLLVISGDQQKALTKFAEAALKQNVTGEVNAHIMDAIRQLSEGGKS